MATGSTSSSDRGGVSGPSSAADEEEGSQTTPSGLKVLDFETLRQRMEKDNHRGRLEEGIDPNSGLLEKLLSCGALTKRETSKLKASEKDLITMSQKLIEIVLEKNNVDKFIAALRDTGQTHWVNYLKGDGENKEEFRGDFPLSDRELQIIDRNSDKLIEIMDSRELVAPLYSSKVINSRQKSAISNLQNDFEQNEAILDVLRRRSLNDYTTTIRCLRESHQEHVAEVFAKGGVLLGVHGEIEGDEQHVNEVEDKLATIIQNILLEAEEGVPDRILEKARLKVVAAKKGKSVVLYVFLESSGEVVELYECYLSGNLRSTIEELFNELLGRADKVTVTVTINVEEYKKCKSFFETPQVTTKPDKEQKKLSESEIIAAVMRNNWDYFVENIRPKSLIDRLHSDKFLSDEQARDIKRMRKDPDKNDDILRIIRSRGLNAYRGFISHLRQTDQHLAADVVEKGGVVVKVTVTNDMNAGVQRSLMNRLNQLRSPEGPPVKFQLVQFLSLLKRADIEIIDAKYDGEMILWFWCRSANALTLMEEWNERKEGEFRDVLNCLFNLLLQGDEAVSEIDDVDMENADRTFVSREPNLVLDDCVPVTALSVRGATCLDSKVYILSHRPTSVTVFEDEDLTEVNRKIALEEIIDPVDIAACQVSNCLYITDRGSASIWRVRTTDDKVVPWLKNIGDPYTLSLTREGHVVMVRRGRPDSLEVYDRDGVMLNKVSLPDIISSPTHAVMTSANTFLVSYGKDEQSSGICEVTTSKGVIAIYDPSLRAVEGLGKNINTVLSRVVNFASFGCPCYLALDERDQVFSTDPINGGVMLFDSQLKLEAILKRKELREPWRVHCVENTRQVVAVFGAEENRSVCIYQAK